MGFLSSLFSDGVSNVVTALGDAIDKNVTSDQERLQLRNELAKIQFDTIAKQGDLDIQLEEEITKRQTNDRTSDSWLSKNIRPMTLIFILVMYSLLSISSGIDFKVTQAYIELLGNWGMLVMSFYFSGRTLEKVMQIKQGSNNG